MKVNKELAQYLARTADVINTVNGGSVFPIYNTKKESDHFRIEIRMPSVNPDDLKVEVDNNNLMVFQKVYVNELHVPNLISLFKLSRDANPVEITAEFDYDKNTLILIIPNTGIGGGFRKNIKIDRLN